MNDNNQAKEVMTESDWIKVFELRCESKRGNLLSLQDSAFLEKAYSEDPERYKAMNDEIFKVTAPFGAFNKD